MKQFVYYFVRQDISPEQQIVQTSHAAYKMGAARKSDPNTTHFIVIGVRDGVALYWIEQILKVFKVQYEYFCEEDMNNEMTSIATYPVNEDEKGVLQAFTLLRLSTGKKFN